MKRDWRAANKKRFARGGCCLKCKTSHRVELAHLIGRTADRYPPFREPPEVWTEPYVVHPDRVVLLCGPATDTMTCHGLYDAHRLDLIPYLTEDEVHQAIADAARLYGHNGLATAWMRLSGQREAIAA